MPSIARQQLDFLAELVGRKIARAVAARRGFRSWRRLVLLAPINPPKVHRVDFDLLGVKLQCLRHGEELVLFVARQTICAYTLRQELQIKIHAVFIDPGFCEPKISFGCGVCWVLHQPVQVVRVVTTDGLRYYTK
ncbi:MAG: hypothetical protein ABSH20_03370 [Tepidisphaeraceae bacterium]